MNLPRFCSCLVLLFAARALRAEIGLDDSYEKVIAEKGQPAGTASAGESLILRYPDATIRLKGGKVVAVNMKPDAATHIEPSTPKLSPLKKPAAVKPAAEAPAPDLKWTTDYNAALARAKSERRHVFLFFTGSDWCGWCKRLNREILSTPEFARYAEDSLVLVELDFPRSKPLSPGVKKQNGNLQRIYQIEGYPTVVVLNEDGKIVGRLGYQEGGPMPFIKELKSL